MNYPEKAVNFANFSESGDLEMFPDNTYSIVRYTVDFFPDAVKLLGKDYLSVLLQKLRRILEIGFFRGERILQVFPDGFDILILYASRKDTDKKIREWSHQFGMVLKSMGITGTISLSAGVSNGVKISEPTRLENAVNEAAFARLFGQLGQNPFVRYYCNEDYQAQRRQRRLELEIPTALQEHQFQVYLQPQYQLDGLKIVGAEALVRWKHPELGLIPPDQFIPFMEQDRYILQLDFYMLEGCCKILRKWRLSGFPHVPISVNFSRLHAATDDFLQLFLSITEKYGVSPDDLRVELTEGAFSDSNLQSIGIAGQLHEKGYKIAMDDFGKGDSSLNALTNLPVDIIKWDKKFLEFQEDNERHRYFLEQIMRIAHELRYQVIVEGVEYPWQVKLLRAMGCRYVQGFLFSKPLPLSTYEKTFCTDGQTV